MSRPCSALNTQQNVQQFKTQIHGHTIYALTMCMHCNTLQHNANTVTLCTLCNALHRSASIQYRKHQRLDQRTGDVWWPPSQMQPSIGKTNQGSCVTVPYRKLGAEGAEKRYCNRNKGSVLEKE